MDNIVLDFIIKSGGNYAIFVNFMKEVFHDNDELLFSINPDWYVRTDISNNFHIGAHNKSIPDCEIEEDVFTEFFNSMVYPFYYKLLNVEKINKINKVRELMNDLGVDINDLKGEK